MSERAQVIKQICEGSSIRSTVRITGVAKNTIVKLLHEIGKACFQYQDKALRNLTCKRIQCDEIWTFRYAKDEERSRRLARSIRLRRRLDLDRHRRRIQS